MGPVSIQVYRAADHSLSSTVVEWKDLVPDMDLSHLKVVLISFPASLLCLSFYVCLFASVFLCLSLSVFLWLSVCLSLSVFLYLSVCLSLSVCLCLSVLCPIGLMCWSVQKRNEVLKDASKEVRTTPIVEGAPVMLSRKQMSQMIDTTLLKCYIQVTTLNAFSHLHQHLKCYAKVSLSAFSHLHQHLKCYAKVSLSAFSHLHQHLKCYAKVSLFLCIFTPTPPPQVLCYGKSLSLHFHTYTTTSGTMLR